MKRSRFTGMIVCVLLLLPGAGVAEELAECSADSDSEFEDVVIDARDGEVDSGDLDYRKGDRVRIVVVNKNPFRYQYKLTVETQEVAEQALSDFLGLSPFAGILASLEEEDDAADQEVAAADDPGDRPVAARDCSPLAADIEVLEPRASDIEEDYKGLRAKLKTLGAAVGAKTKVYNKAKVSLQSAEIQCSKLRTLLVGDGNTAGLRDQLEFTSIKKSDFDAAKNQLGGIVFAANRQMLKIAEVKAKDQGRTCVVPDKDGGNKLAPCPLLPDCPAERRQLENYELVASLAVASKAGLGATISTLEGGFDVVAAAHEDIERVLGKSTSFVTVRELPKFRRATDVTIKLERKDLSDEDAEFVAFRDIKLNFGGGAKFALAAGLAYAELPINSFERIQGVSLGRDGFPVLDEDGNEQVTIVVGQTEDSSSRYTPLLVLHGKLGSLLDDLSVHLSTGLTVNTEDNADIEYLLGASFGLIDDQLFVTFGFYYGESQQLGDSFYVGQALGEEVATIPVIKEEEWKPAIAISYKFR